MRKLKASKEFTSITKTINTTTVGELVDFLKQLPVDMPVVVTYEGCIRAITGDVITIGKNVSLYGNSQNTCDVLFFDL